MQPASLDIWQQKYQLKDQSGNPIDADVDASFQRVARKLASVEKTPERWYPEFLTAMRNGAIPAGRILSNAGAEEFKPSTSTINCVVSQKITDSISGIMQTAKEGAESLAAGCGIGYCFSTLRPKGAYVNGAGATTSGALSFMNIFDATCFTIASAGGRRGAQMATLHIWHPDIFEYIKAKREDGKFRQFNLSVLITKEFVEAVKNDEDWQLYFPQHRKEVCENTIKVADFPFKSDDYITNEGLTICKVYRTVKARELWETIMRSTYDFAEPGFLLVDEINDMNNLWWDENVVSTNPCLAKGTLVETPNGSTPVENIAVGDYIRNPAGVLRATAAHIFHTQKSGKLCVNTRLSELSVGASVFTFDTLTRKSSTVQILSIEPDGLDTVYDLYEPVSDTWITEGIVNRGCGEQPLAPYGSCLLGSINLTKFVLNPFTERATFDWTLYRETIRVFSRMLDNVVEINGLPLEQQREELIRKRRHGMGFFGLGSAMTMMCVKYGSEESVKFTDLVSENLAVEGWKAALELSKEKGAAPIMDELFDVTEEMLRKRPEIAEYWETTGDRMYGRMLHQYSRYMQRIAEVAPELVEELALHGARYSHHSSIAPTGTIALSVGDNASNGIEPSFAHKYSRNIIREGKNSKEKVDVYSFELLEFRRLFGEDAPLPDYFITSDDITAQQHIDVQAAAQKWIDSAISKTVNIPTDYPFEDFKDVYLYAIEKKLKGVATFRFNPEVFQGVLVKDADLENTNYQFTLEDGSVVVLKGNEDVLYEGEVHSAANLFDALKEGYYGKF
jgi:ribonucleotide reductase alpha subunit